MSVLCVEMVAMQGDTGHARTLRCSVNVEASSVQLDSTALRLGDTTVHLRASLGHTGHFASQVRAE